MSNPAHGDFLCTLLLFGDLRSFVSVDAIAIDATSIPTTTAETTIFRPYIRHNSRMSSFSVGASIAWWLFCIKTSGAASSSIQFPSADPKYPSWFSSSSAEDFRLPMADDDDAFSSVFVSSVPVGVEGSGKLVEEERNAMRFARRCCGFYDTRELRCLTDQRPFVSTEPFQCLAGRRAGRLLSQPKGRHL